MTAPSLALSSSVAPAAAAPTTGNVVARLIAAAALYRQRRRLAQLDRHMLDDIGISRQQALDESRRPLWDAPDHWLR